MNARWIVLRVIKHIQMTAFLYLPPKPNSRIQDHVLGILGIPTCRLEIKRGVWCQWSKPRGYKLNFDGSAKENDSSGGRIIRDANDILLVAFSSFYGEGTHNGAEFRALRDSLSLCHALGILEFEVEGDSMIVINAMKQGRIKN